MQYEMFYKINYLVYFLLNLPILEITGIEEVFVMFEHSDHEKGEDTLGLWRGLGIGIAAGTMLWAAIIGLIWYFL